MAVKSHHGHGSSYERKHLIGACLMFQKFSPFSCQHAGGHGAGEVAEAENYTSRVPCRPQGERERQSLWNTLTDISRSVLYKSKYLPINLGDTQD